MRSKLFFLLSLTVLIISSCSKKADDSNGEAESSVSVAEAGVSEVGSQTTSTEGGVSVGTSSVKDQDLAFQEMDYLDQPGQQRSLAPLSICLFTTHRSTCTSNVSTIDWDGCTIGTATMSGGWSETWTAGFCADGSRPGVLTNNTNVVRTSSLQTLTFKSGASIETDTAAHTAWDGTAIPATGVKVAAAVSGSVTTRTVTIYGLHRVIKGTQGQRLADHSITSSGLTVTGTRATADRTVSGSLNLYHNLANYTATQTFTAVKWGSASCCYPTSGTISSNFSGSVTGTTLLTFTTTCGAATFQGSDGVSTSVALSQCH